MVSKNPRIFFLPCHFLEIPGNNVKYGCLRNIYLGNNVAQIIITPYGVDATWFTFFEVMNGLISHGSGAAIFQI